MDDRKKKLRNIIAAKSFSRGGHFKLASGQSSGFYFDMKPTVLDPEGARLAAELILEAVADEDLDCVGGMAVGAVPIVAAVAMASAGTERHLPGFLVRKEVKERGTEKQIEGNIVEGGVYAGQGLMTWAQLSAIFEPIGGTFREIIGFDTFDGFPSIDAKDDPLDTNLLSVI